MTRRFPDMRITQDQWSTGDAIAAGVMFILGMVCLVALVAFLATVVKPAHAHEAMPVAPPDGQLTVCRRPDGTITVRMPIAGLLTWRVQRTRCRRMRLSTCPGKSTSRRSFGPRAAFTTAGRRSTMCGPTFTATASPPSTT